MTFTTLIVGEGALLIACAEVLLRYGDTIQPVVSATDAIPEWALTHKIFCASHVDEALAAMNGQGFDYLFSIANLSIVPSRVLALPRLGAVNFHDGPLPRYAGLHATTWAILNQEPAHGVTWHEMRETVDAGDIVQQRLFPLAPDETAVSLNRRWLEAGIESF